MQACGGNQITQLHRGLSKLKALRAQARNLKMSKG
jgi:hypothetical protein